jgi:hypothetical protein
MDRGSLYGPLSRTPPYPRHLSFAVHALYFWILLDVALLLFVTKVPIAVQGLGFTSVHIYFLVTYL